ncbi:MAG TPA: tRNA pseudouridine(38-40) synthase TruA [Candidatus Dormibacteraeota bacterium]|nr:tRNA pseudouridine(38-40) synthase TruA [Candidatus Dormibacteraeota bacterium]
MSAIASLPTAAPVRPAAPRRAQRPTPDASGTRHVYALTLEYDGTGFSGWQRQPGRRTVEGVLLDALAAVTGEPAPLTAAGRIDAGAHAHAQVVGCTLRRPWDCDRLRGAVNARLPGDVVVVDVREAPPGFHARFDAVARTYRYVIASRRERPAVLRQHAWLVRGSLDVAAMESAARSVLGTHDLAAFGRSPRPGGSTVRTVHDITVRRLRASSAPANAAPAPAGALAPGDGPWAEASVVVIDVTADAFLYGMMRNLVAALADVGTGRLGADAFVAMVREGRRPPRLTPAPARGLHQWRVQYPGIEPAPSDRTPA